MPAGRGTPRLAGSPRSTPAPRACCRCVARRPLDVSLRSPGLRQSVSVSEATQSVVPCCGGCSTLTQAGLCLAVTDTDPRDPLMLRRPCLTWEGRSASPGPCPGRWRAVSRLTAAESAAEERLAG